MLTKARWVILYACLPALLFLSGCGNREGMTPLLIASHSGNVDEIKKHVAQGSDLNEQSAYGWTALMFASWKGHRDVVELLLQQGANPNIISKAVPGSFDFGTTGGHPPTTALREAISDKHFDIAKLLLSRGALLDAEAISQAGGTGNVAFLEHLKQIGTDFNKPSATGFWVNPLRSAAEKGELKAVQWLLDNGADPNRVAGNNTTTPLYGAVTYDHIDIVRCLLERGANPNQTYFQNQSTALYTAATKHTQGNRYSRNIEIIKLLLAFGADPLFINSYNKLTAVALVKVQRANGEKYFEPGMSEESRTRHEASRAHRDRIIEL